MAVGSKEESVVEVEPALAVVAARFDYRMVGFSISISISISIC